MKLGLFLLAGQFPGLTEAEALAGAVDNAVAAEQAGLDSVWFAEHHFITYGLCPSAVALAANVLGRTSRISIGTGVCILSNRHPVALAEETALLDHLSGGRFHLGVGRGGPWVDLEVFGTGLARFEDGFAEALDLVVDSLEQGRVGADGQANRFFNFRPVPVVPRPFTEPRPPMVVAATTLPTVEVAAERGLPLLLGLHATIDEQRDLLDHYAKIAAEHGHDPAAVDHIGTAVATSPIRELGPKPSCGSRCGNGSTPVSAGTCRSLPTPRPAGTRRRTSSTSSPCTRSGRPRSASPTFGTRPTSPAFGTCCSWWKAPVTGPGPGRRFIASEPMLPPSFADGRNCQGRDTGSVVGVAKGVSVTHYRPGNDGA